MKNKQKMGTEELREYRRSLRPRAIRRLLEQAVQERRRSLACLGFDSYDEYLDSHMWRQIRSRIYVRADGTCECCRQRKPENVHHWSYTVATLRGDRPQNLEAVCKSCHEKFHAPKPLTPQKAARREARRAWAALVAKGGLVAQPRDMTPRLVKPPAA